jgi:AraC family transcriptional regulator
MNFRVESHEAMGLTGLPLRTTVEGGRQFEEIPAFWSRAMESGAFEGLIKSVPAGSRLGICGVSMGMEDGISEFTYLIAVETPGNRSNLPEGCIDAQARAGTWAIFESRGPLPGSLQDTIRQIYTEWFPTSGYEHAGGPELEIYSQGDTTAHDYYCEVWIPVAKVARD